MISFSKSTTFVALLLLAVFGVTSSSELQHQTICVVDPKDGSEECYKDSSFKPKEEDDFYAMSVYHDSLVRSPLDSYQALALVLPEDDLGALMSCETGKSLVGVSATVVAGVIGVAMAIQTGGAGFAVAIGLVSAAGSMAGFVTCDSASSSALEIDDVEKIFHTMYRKQQYQEAFRFSRFFNRDIRVIDDIMLLALSDLRAVRNSGEVVILQTMDAPILGLNLLFRTAKQVIGLTMILIGRNKQLTDCRTEVGRLFNTIKIVEERLTASLNKFRDDFEKGRTCSKNCDSGRCSGRRYLMGHTCTVKLEQLEDGQRKTFDVEHCAERDGKCLHWAANHLTGRFCSRSDCSIWHMNNAKTRTHAMTEKWYEDVLHAWRFDKKSGWDMHKRNFDFMKASLDRSKLEEFCERNSETPTCGNGNRGNGSCSNPGHCCNPAGFCGTGQEHCNWCGQGNIGNGLCRDGTCCSAYGWCYSGDDWCNNQALLAGDTSLFVNDTAIKS